MNEHLANTKEAKAKSKTMMIFFLYYQPLKTKGLSIHFFEVIISLLWNGPYDLDLKKGVDFGLKNSVYLDLNSFTVSNFDLKPKLCQQCT